MRARWPRRPRTCCSSTRSIASIEQQDGFLTMSRRHRHPIGSQPEPELDRNVPCCALPGSHPAARHQRWDPIESVEAEEGATCISKRRARRPDRQRRRRRPVPAQPGRECSSGLDEPLDPAGVRVCIAGRGPTSRGATTTHPALPKAARVGTQSALSIAGSGCRRIPSTCCPTVRFASEDIGLADPQALVQCLAAKDSYDFLGSPEGELAIVQACLYLATAPKSNAAYVAQKSAWRSAKETGSLMPPAHILNAPTRLMKDIGYGKGYAYDHDAAQGYSGQDYWPAEMTPQTYYRPTDRGFEAKVAERIAYWDEMRRKIGKVFQATTTAKGSGFTGTMRRPLTGATKIISGARAWYSRS